MSTSVNVASVATRFEMKLFVEVAFVIVPLVARSVLIEALLIVVVASVVVPVFTNDCVMI